MKKHLMTCMQVEEAVGDIYRDMAQSSRLSHKVRQTLLELGNDEDDHASQLRFAMRFPENAVVSCPPEADKRMLEMLREAEQIKLKVAQIEVDDQQAISIGIELEKKFSQVHIANAFDFKEQHLKDMFAAMARADDTHCQRLIDLQQQMLKP